MTRRRRARLFQLIALTLVVAVGAVAYRYVAQPDRRILVRLAEAKLKSIFPGIVEYDAALSRIDLIDGVEIRHLVVRASPGGPAALEADTVRIQHDVLALASGRYVPERIEIDGAVIRAHETEEGFEPDFEITLSSSDVAAATPEIRLTNGTIVVASMPESRRFRAGANLVLDGVHLDLVPDPRVGLLVAGGFHTRGLGQDEIAIRIGGTADPQKDLLDVYFTWKDLRITEELLGVLREDTADALEKSGLEKGTLRVSLKRFPDEAEGRIIVAVQWSGPLEVQRLIQAPDTEVVDARNLEQLRALFQKAHLDLEVKKNRIDIRDLVTVLGGGAVKASGWIDQEGEALHLVITIRDAKIHAPDFRR
ncbi:MAG: hypothetical protein ACC662_00820, partial [Planctomycetota bacterium]